MSIAGDVWGYMRTRKKWWLLPMILVLLAVGALIAASGSPILPFVYTLF